MVITSEQFQEMLGLQERLEVRIGGEDWRDAGHDYALCVHMEAAELIDHLGWKHWKKQERDEAAAAMELIDIWHFAMAYMLERDALMSGKDLRDHCVEALAEYELQPIHDVVQAAIGLSFSMYTARMFPTGNFCCLLAELGMTFEDVYEMYICKNVLNWFRQDHGYAEGRYNKVWSGREDNEHLLELSNTLGKSLTFASLYKLLDTRYNLVCPF